MTRDYSFRLTGHSARNARRSSFHVSRSALRGHLRLRVTDPVPNAKSSRIITPTLVTPVQVKPESLEERDSRGETGGDQARCGALVMFVVIIADHRAARGVSPTTSQPWRPSLLRALTARRRRGRGGPRGWEALRSATPTPRLSLAGCHRLRPWLRFATEKDRSRLALTAAVDDERVVLPRIHRRACRAGSPSRGVDEQVENFADSSLCGDIFG